jgi:hypothetical protein
MRLTPKRADLPRPSRPRQIVHGEMEKNEIVPLAHGFWFFPIG